MSDAVVLRDANTARPAARSRARPRLTVHLPARIEEYVSDEQWAVFRRAIDAVRALGVPFAIGGGLATSLYTGVWRTFKDIDLYVLPADRERAIDAVLGAGLTDYYDQLAYDRTWIFRSIRDGAIVDVMWSMANHAGDVEPAWMARGPRVVLRDEPLRLLAPEDVFWTKVHVLQRDRCDWPDLLNLMFAAGPAFDWPRLVERMTGHERLLGAALSLFAWMAPGRAAELPAWLWTRLQLAPPAGGPRCSRERVRLLDTRDWFAAIDT